jgi:hypothetical protein
MQLPILFICLQNGIILFYLTHPPYYKKYPLKQVKHIRLIESYV